MQFEAMDVFDIRKEPQAVRDEYGDNPFGHAARWHGDWWSAECGSCT